MTTAFVSRMTDEHYGEGYWERAQGSNYSNYGDDPGWEIVSQLLAKDARSSDFVNDPSTEITMGRRPRVYEVACSKGYLVGSLLRAGFNASGIDISRYAISKAPPEAEGYVFVGNATHLPWEDGTADFVVSMEFFEHVPEDEVDRVLSEKMRVLKHGGVLVMKIGIVIPSDHPFAGQDDHDITHYTVQDREWWEGKFSGAGLVHYEELQRKFDIAFAHRDWVGRFFVWRKP